MLRMVLFLYFAFWPAWMFAGDPGLTLSELAGRYHGDAGTLRACRLEITEGGAYRHACFEGPTMTQTKGRVHLQESLVWLVQGDSKEFGDSSPDMSDAIAARGRSPIYSPVRWGQRQYLLAPGQLLDFCIAIARKAEPRRERRGIFYLREGDEDRPAPVTTPAECARPPVLAR